MKTHFIADTHIDHEGIIDMAGRWDCGTIEEHTGVVLEGINSAVSEADRLIFAGDVAWRSITNFLAAIRCKNVHLINGNHDKASFGKAFKSVADVDIFSLPGDHKVFVSHYPHCYWPASHYGSLHLYGHVHADREETLDLAFPGRRSMDCGIDNAYRLLGKRRPFSEGEIIDILASRPGHDDVSFYKKLQDARREKWINETTKRIVRWPDGFETDYEDFDYELHWSHRSDDFQIVRVPIDYEV